MLSPNWSGKRSRFDYRYMSLRLPLTMIAIGGLGVTIAGDLMGQQQQQQQPVVEPAEPEQDA